MKLKHLTLLLLISCCAPTIRNFDDYQKQFLPKTEFMPSLDNIEGKPPKIVVLALDENQNEVATKAQLGNSIANNIENILSQNRLAELVDRSAGNKLQKEIALAEMNKTGSYKGPKIADYAISGSISNASFTSKYSGGITYFDSGGNLITAPPRFSYYANVQGNIKIYELPSLTVLEAIEFSGSSSRSENVQQKGGLSLGAIQIGGEQVHGAQRDDGLVRTAGEDAIRDSRTEIKNFFAKKGYIMEKRVYNKKTIFKINLGSLDGLKQGDKFEVIGQYESENPLSQKSEIEHRIIAQGVVSDKIDPKTCWVIIDDEDKIKAIRLGDSVKIKYEKNWLLSFIKMAKTIF